MPARPHGAAAGGGGSGEGAGGRRAAPGTADVLRGRARLRGRDWQGCGSSSQRHSCRSRLPPCLPPSLRACLLRASLPPSVPPSLRTFLPLCLLSRRSPCSVLCAPGTRRAEGGDGGGRCPAARGTVPRRLPAPGAREGRRSAVDPGEGGSRLPFPGASCLSLGAGGSAFSAGRGQRLGGGTALPLLPWPPTPIRAWVTPGAVPQVRVGATASLLARARWLQRTNLHAFGFVISHCLGPGSKSDNLCRGQLLNLRGNPNRTRRIKI